MLFMHDGSVIPFVGVNPITDHISVHVFATYARRGAKLDDLLVNCWSRGFSAYDTNLICSANGYALCVVELRRRQVWDNWEAGWRKHCASQPDLSYLDKQNISR